MTIEERVGERSTAHRQVVTSEAIERFAKAVGSKMRAEAPPTYMTTLRAAEFELFRKLGIPLASILHAEQQYSYEPGGIPAGSEVEFVSVFKSFAQKRGKSATLSFLEFETDVYRLDGGERRRSGSSLTTIVVRGELP
ncbi:MAG: MaoC family dehydratase N-terminal domain-containing protein [Bdellovibrionales bacterium]|nr:MaoC family dehydratase N-terminal domain-containing protein [Bdellovibrionales bacterium]